MSRDPHRQEPTAAERFAEQAGERPAGVVRELVDFLRQNKKWWLIPIVVVLLLVGALIILGGTAAGPLIYTFW